MDWLISEATHSGACIMHNARDIVGKCIQTLLVTSADYACFSLKYTVEHLW